MDFLLAGTLFSLFMEFQCRVIVQRGYLLRRLACGKHSAPSRTPFRSATKTVRLPTGIAFTFRPESCSESLRNGVQLQTGIAFIFDRIPQLTLEPERLKNQPATTRERI